MFQKRIAQDNLQHTIGAVHECIAYWFVFSLKKISLYTGILSKGSRPPDHRNLDLEYQFFTTSVRTLDQIQNINNSIHIKTTVDRQEQNPNHYTETKMGSYAKATTITQFMDSYYMAVCAL